MPIEVACPSCGRVIRAPDTLAGKKVKCPDCKTVVAVPDAAASATPPAKPSSPKPAASRPTASRPAARPSVPPPRTATPPPSFGGVADLISEEITLDQQKRREQELADFERQQQEAILAVYEAPKRAAEALRMKRLHGPFENPRPLEIGKALERSWQVYKANLGPTMLVCWFALIVGMIGYAAIFGVFFAVDLAFENWAVNNAPDFEVRLVIVPIRIVGFVTAFFFLAWMLAGQTAFVLKLAKGQQAQFADVFRYHGNVPAIVGAWIIYQLVTYLPYLPVLPLMFIHYLEDERLIVPPESLYRILNIIAGILVLFLFGATIVRIIKWTMFLYVIVDINAGSADGLQNSALLLRTRNALGVLLLQLLILALCLASCATVVGLPFIYPWAMLLLAVAYTDMTGQKPSLLASGEAAPAAI